MENNNDHIDQLYASKANAHDVESAEPSLATAYEKPPALPFSEPEKIKEEAEPEEVAEDKAKETAEPTIDSQPDVPEAAEPIEVAPPVDIVEHRVEQKPAQEEREEEVTESPEKGLSYTEDAPTEPNEGNNDGGSNDAGSNPPTDNGGDDDPIQSKPNNEANPKPPTKPTKKSKEEKPVQSKDKKQDTHQIKTPDLFPSAITQNSQDVMAKMEASFGTTFSNVNIHKDSSKATDNNALAFAQGNDIHFAPGKYNPNSQEGQELLGHELAHVVQQRNGQVKPTAHLDDGTLVNDDPKLEKEADVLGAKAASFSQASTFKSVEEDESQVSKIVQKKTDPKDRKVSAFTIQRRPTTETEPSIPEPPEPGLDGYSDDELAAAEAELNQGPGPEAQFEVITEKALPPEKKKKEPAKVKLPPAEAPAAKKVEKQAAPGPFTPPPSNVSAEGKSVKDYLRIASQPVLDEGKNKAKGLETNERRNEGAMVKTSNAKKAVVAPPGEEQSRKDGDKTRKTDAKPAPEVREELAKSDFQKSLTEGLPKKIKEVEKFKGSSKARQITNKAKMVIAQDKDSTNVTYNSVVRTEFTLQNVNDNPVPLGPMEEAEITPPFQIADKVVPDLKPLKTQFEGSTTEIEAKMAEQGATAENLSIAKSSKLDTFKAKKSEFTDLETNLDSTLDNIYQEGSAQTKTKFEEAEAQGRKDMRDERVKKLTEAKEDQVTTKSDLEKKREEIVRNIEAIYSPVEQKVNERLEKLDETTRVEFENGMNDATKEFEENVDTRFRAFKKKRYKGFWGPAKWLKDKILGVNGLPEVKEILDSERENYENNIDKLIEDITGRNKQVIEECKREINEAKTKIDEYIDSLPDALKQIARDASQVIKDKLIALEESVKEKEKELENLLSDLRQEAMDWVEAKIEEYNKKWGGILSKILSFLGDIALEILRGLLNAAGVNGDMIIDVVKDTVSAIIAIIKDPVGFLRNMISIIKGGFIQFFSGGLRNLLDAFISWLTGADGTIVFPTEWTLKNILMMLLDFFGLGWESIKGYFAEELGPQVVGIAENVVELISLIAEKGADGILEWIENKVGRIVEGGWSTFADKYGKKLGLANIDIMEMFTTLLQKIKSDGLAGVWEFIKEYGATLMQVLKDAVIDAVIDFAKNMVITAGINFLLTMATGIIGAIVKVVQIVIAFFENMGTIGKLVLAILKSVIHAAFDAIDAGIQLIMDAIKLLVHMILNFLCRILGLGNIPQKVQDAIGTVIDGAQKFVKDVVKWISDKLKNLWQKLKDFFTNLFGGGQDDGAEDGEEGNEEDGEFPTDFSHGVVPLNGQGMDSKGGGFAFPWGGSSGDYDFGGSPYGGGENARQVDLAKPELAGMEEDAEFQEEMDQLTAKAEEQKEHETTDKKVQETIDAAESPANEVDSKAKSKQVDKMGEEDAGEFNSDDFKRKLLDKVDAIAPANLDETEKFRGSGKASQLKATIASDVSEEGKETKKDIEETAKEKPDTSGFDVRDSEPLPSLSEMPDQGNIAEEKAAVKSQPDEIIEAPIEEENIALDAQYEEAEITDEQLTTANEPTFTAALDAKTAAKQNMETTKVDFRVQEQEVISKSQGEAESEGNEKLSAFLSTRSTELTNVEGAQKAAKSKDEQERKKVADQLEAIYGRTKSAVETKLAGIDGQVNAMFDAAAETAKSNFESYVDTSIQAYKAERYAGVSGKAQWLVDLFKGLPAEVNQFYTQARDNYVAEMDAAVSGIADFVTAELNDAKRMISQGKDEIERFVSQLDPNLQKYANEAASNITAKFEALDQTIADKQTQLIDNLAAKYTENLGEIDTRVEELMASNQGLIQKAVDSVTSVIETINNMRNMLVSVINDGLAVINEILKNPIQFLSNLIQGVSQGFNQFASNITSHLQNGLSGWLFGTLGDAGIEIPSSFDLAGILSIITQVVGLTWNYIRARIVKFIGEDNMARLETTVEMFQAFRRDGVQGFKDAAAEEGAAMKETVIGEIKSFVIQEVIQKGIVWILSLFNPASAFVRACMMIYDVVMFFVNSGAQIAELVQSVMGAISAIVAGNVGAMASAIEGTLSRALPLAIGFMANILGLGGLANKVKSIIKKAQAPVNKVVDKIVGKAKNLAGKFTGKDDEEDNSEENEQGATDEAWDKGIASLVRIQTASKNKGKTEKEMDDALRGIKSTHGFDRLTKSADGEFWEVKAVKGDKNKTLDIKADLEGKDPGEQAADPEVEAKAQEGFAELRAKAAKYDGEGATKEEADKLVKDVKAKHPVFKVLRAVDKDGDQDGWDVEFSYNPEGVKLDIIKNEADEVVDIVINVLAIEEGELGPGKKIGQRANGKTIVNKHYPSYFNSLDLEAKKAAKVELECNVESRRRDEGLNGGNGSEGTNELRKEIEGEQYPNFQAHHIIPRETRNDFSEFYEKIGFNIENGSINGIMLPPNKETLEQTKKDYSEIGTKYDNYAFHQGSHPDYTNKIKQKLQVISTDYYNKDIDKAIALDEVIEISIRVKNVLKNSPGTKVNDTKI